MGLALQLLTLFNSVAPNIASMVLLVRKKDGTLTIMPLLDEADATFDANIKQAGDWLKAHPAP